jgi:hypothetical protein
VATAIVPVESRQKAISTGPIIGANLVRAGEVLNSKTAMHARR